MEPFSITCDSCASRLKVRQAGAIGQILACPKCGSMVKVEPPEGWEPPAEAQDVSNSQDVQDTDLAANRGKSGARPQTSRTTGDGERSQRQVVTGSKSRGTRGKTAQAVGDANHASAGGAAQPLLPDGNWTSAAARDRQRLVLMISAAALILILCLSVVGYLVVRNGSDSKNVVAQVTDDSEDGSKNGGVEDSQDSPSSKADDLENAETDPKTEPGDADDGSQTPAQAPVDEDTAPVIIRDVPGQQPGQDSDNGAEDSAAGKGNRNTDGSIIIAGGGPEAGETAPSEEAGLNPIAKTEDAEAGFNRLTNPNTSDELIQLLDGESRFGVGNVFIDKPRLREINPAVAMDLEIGIAIESVTFTQALRHLSHLTQVPIQLDIPQLRAHNIDYHFETRLDVELQSARAVLADLIADKGMVIEELPWGLKITAADRDVLQVVEYEVFEYEQQPEESAAAIEEFIRKHFEPDSWLKSEQRGPATLDRAGRRFTIKQTRLVHAALAEFFSKVNRSHQLATQNVAAVEGAVAPTADEKLFLSRRSSCAELLGRESNLDLRVALPILDVFNKVESQTGLVVLVNWERVLAEGWTPETELPWYQSNGTARQILDNIVHAMELDYRVVDRQTVELTTVADNQSRLELEVYPCQQIVRGGQLGVLEDLLGYSVGRQLDYAAGMFFDYEQESQCIVAILPQPLQHKLEMAWRYADEQARLD